MGVPSGSDKRRSWMAAAPRAEVPPRTRTAVSAGCGGMGRRRGGEGGRRAVMYSEEGSVLGVWGWGRGRRCGRGTWRTQERARQAVR